MIIINRGRVLTERKPLGTEDHTNKGNSDRLKISRLPKQRMQSGGGGEQIPAVGWHFARPSAAWFYPSPGPPIKFIRSIAVNKRPGDGLGSQSIGGVSERPISICQLPMRSESKWSAKATKSWWFAREACVCVRLQHWEDQRGLAGAERGIGRGLHADYKRQGLCWWQPPLWCHLGTPLSGSRLGAPYQAAPSTWQRSLGALRFPSILIVKKVLTIWGLSDWCSLSELLTVRSFIYRCVSSLEVPSQAQSGSTKKSMTAPWPDRILHRPLRMSATGHPSQQSGQQSLGLNCLNTTR